MRKTALLTLIAALVVAMSGAAGTASGAPAKAWVSSSLWDPGYIISDQQFYDGNAMSAAQIQTFLNARVSACRPELSAGPSDPIICLKDYRQTTVSRSADAYCPNPYVGASNETAATIIFKVAQACNVSPKVILVTLQKETGLVTHTWPSTWRYDRAMGFGCSDTAPCIETYQGFFNQVYTAARQFQRYRLLPTSYNYRPGVENRIGYHPDASCGAQTVFIQNSATAALYNYTPYVPNSQALSAMPGTGNSCSSYGNRNFWMYYWEWFGSPVAAVGTTAMSDVYQSLGGASGPLGAAVTTPQCSIDTDCLWTYQHGAISWTRALGAVATAGTMGDAWLANRQAYGRPIASETVVTDPHGNGVVQAFERGVVHSSAAGTYLVTSGTMAAYSSAGWLRGDVGWPTSGPICGGAAAGCVQTFQGGIASLNSVGDGTFMRADVAGLYVAAGSQGGSFGLPTATQTTVFDANGDGVVQAFQAGVVHASNAGVYFVPNSVMTAYSAAGWLRGALGWPVADHGCGASACVQAFAGGVVRTGLNGTGAIAVTVNPPVKAAYDAAGGASGWLGQPIANVNTVTDKNGNGVVQAFEGGLIHAGPSGAFAVPNSVMPTYSANGWLRGSLGWPTAPAVCDVSGCTQAFAGGTIVVPAGQAGLVVAPIVNTAIRDLYNSTGGATGTLGYPTVPQTSVTDKNGNGYAQAFQNGVVHSSAAGAFLVPTRVMPTYSANGWLRGSLGWPIAAATCDSTRCTQEFTGGTILVPNGQRGFVVAPIGNGAIRGLYDSTGGASGPLGYPTAPQTQVTDANGNGVAQAFQNGVVHSSAAGTYLVPSAVMPAYSARGWIRGSLGWPAGTAVCDAGGCVQLFQRGVIDTH